MDEFNLHTINAALIMLIRHADTWAQIEEVSDAVLSVYRRYESMRAEKEQRESSGATQTPRAAVGKGE